MFAQQAPAELIRDTWGVPHVFAGTDAQAAYGLGYAAAEDRGFQMVYFQRIIQGRLAELLGDVAPVKGDRTALESDRRMRTIGYARAARAVANKLDTESIQFLRAYCDGVNDYFKRHAADRPPEFKQLGLEPEPWTPADCILSWWHVAQFFAGDGTGDWSSYLRNVAPPAAGGERKPRAAPRVDDDAAVVQREDVSDEWVSRVEQFAREHGASGRNSVRDAQGPKFSHAWVVGGRQTTTGAAVLVSDPQTAVTNPSLFYEFHAKGKTFNVRGIGVAGSPVILIGFTSKVAWGLTALAADQADLFRLKIDPEHPNRYELDGQWREMDVATETIRVKGKEPVNLQIRSTIFGPVITEFVDEAGQNEFALKLIPVSVADSETVQAALPMWRASDVRQFHQALGRWQFPSANCVFGDAEGNIGYTVLGAIPVRSREAIDGGKYPHPGTSTKYDWQTMIPNDLIPHVFNPHSGRLLSANHRQIESFYPLYVGTGKGTTGETLRSWRLRERLQAKEMFTPKDVLAIHFDNVNPARRDIVRIGFHIRSTRPGALSPESVRALDYLQSWYDAGARLDLTSAGTALANLLNLKFYASRTDLVETYGAGDTGLALFLKDVVHRVSDNDRAEVSSQEVEYVDGELRDAWNQAVQKYGPDPETWQDQAQRELTGEIMARYGSLDGFPSLDPSADMHWPALVSVDVPTIFCQRGQSYTQFVPLDNADRAMTILPIGPSERIGSPFRTSTLDLWVKGELHPAPLSRKAVEAIEASREVLNR